ncbi:MAG: IS200/IS605 family transposase [Bacteroidales bacterium]|nr:IS200/IS605 family transposase [Bacteroidales bacterium]
MSYTQLYYHIVIRPYKSQPVINEEHETELYAYIHGMCKNRNVNLLRIGGMPDHIHLFVALPSMLPVAKFVQEIKSVTSFWLKNNPHFPNFDHWSKEYAAFTYSIRDKEMIINYIRNQKEHHKNVFFRDEYRQFVIDNGLEIDDRYFLVD